MHNGEKLPAGLTKISKGIHQSNEFGVGISTIQCSGRESVGLGLELMHSMTGWLMLGSEVSVLSLM